MFRPEHLNLFDDESDDCFGLSPPHDGSEFQLFPDLNDDVVDVDKHANKEALGTSASENENKKVIDKLQVDSKKVIKLRMNPVQERELVTFLSQKTKAGETPCVQLIQHVPGLTGATPVVNEPNKTASVNSKLFSRWNNDGPCLSKSALSARENRLKKKRYMEGLEQSVKDLFDENKHLKEQNETKDKAIQVLMNEVKYLRGILANDSALSSLLQNISKTPGLKFTSDILSPTPPKSSILAKKRPLNDKSPFLSSSAHMQAKKSKVLANDESSDDNAGICLHVSKGNVSFELCASCSKNAQEDDKP